MGLLDAIIEWLGLRRREAFVLVVGLDNSGKTSLLNFLLPRGSRSNSIVPTVGFNVEHFSCKGLLFTAFDMSGQSQSRSLWANYYRTAHGIIFVIDSADRSRIIVVREEFHQLLSHRDISSRNVPILIFANKMDKKNALSIVGISSTLGLDKVLNNPWRIYASNALKGDGIADGIEWLCSSIKEAIGLGRQ